MKANYYWCSYSKTSYENALPQITHLFYVKFATITYFLRTMPAFLSF